jgi:hypothetical protein
MEYLDWNIPFWDKLDYSPLKYLAIGMAKAAPDPYSNSGVRLYFVSSNITDDLFCTSSRLTVGTSSRGTILSTSPLPPIPPFPFILPTCSLFS